ncbi:MBL fold metallo-hydrolase [Muricoccus pecuniae]|uniref:L-ascorbate metabolism protein UlaG (Beta-lactamase superfamily) n=1 Tax=Muricoccus pecuniae TaxID=693023 RepID=A0A840YIG3_9PROT|nr:MBL fold metallo-hydrolase [Roseomonas pecuniae]MBB5693843.1 L-ascorbate metabolism protein UlaG (beta-lactamase superfamily) [Roseomonas pecuniae]
MTDDRSRSTHSVPRRRFAALLGAAPVLGMLPWMGGCSASGMASYEGPVSDHFDGARFFNPGGTGPRGLMDLARWKLNGNDEDWPDAYPSPFPPDRPPRRVEGRALRVSFVGHASFLIQGAGLNILTDPVWSERASPFSFVGPKRANPPGIAFDDLPPIDIILVSHGHYDHLDVETLARLWRRDRPRIVAPLGNDTTIREHDPAIEVSTADWGGAVPLGNGAEAVLEQVHHWTARGLWDRNRALWCGFVLRGLGDGVFFAGDTGFDDGRPFRRVAERHGPLGLALLPIGAYEPRWFMAGQHMNPADAVQGFKLLGARQALGYHWGTFKLTDEGIGRPLADLAVALAAEGLAPGRFIGAQPGLVWSGTVGP